MAALAAGVLEVLFLTMDSLDTYSTLPGMSVSPPARHPLILFIPVIVALLFTFITRYGLRYEQWIRPLRSLVYINAGIPLGFEGMLMDRSLSLAEGRTRGRLPLGQMLAVAAASGGIAYLFGSPLTAIALMIELTLIECSWPGFTVAILGGGTGMLLRYWLRGSDPVFLMPHVAVPSIPALLVYAATGILIGLVAVLAKRIVNGMSRLFSWLPVDNVWWPVVAAIITGVSCYFFPELTGAGYEHIDNLLLGRVTLQFLVVMGIGKLILMGVAVGSGIPGGTIAPLLVAGGALGLFITFLMQFAFPAVPLNYALAGLAGMCAMLAGGNRVLPAAIFFAIETTHVTAALLPAACASLSSYLVVFLIAKKRVTQPAVLPRKIS